ncbi:MAG: 3-hydroxyacyl-CoA dehydrogenase NAD-binding domain-containing protein [Bacteroidota bacterium]
MSKSIQKIAVIGGGVMGRGIALTAARAGYETILFDIKEEMLEKADQYAQKFLAKSVTKGKMSEEARSQALEKLSFSTDSTALIADCLIEAVPENLALKHKVLTPLEAQNAPDTIIASNTSTIPITRIAAGLERPQQVVGMHFFNPAPIMKLVEVISGAATAPEVTDSVFSLAQNMGKVPVKTKDAPGFIVNRVARQFYLEAQRILQDQTADHAAIDRLMKSSGFRMGPFELMDLIGIETNHEVSKSMYEAFFYEERFQPSLVQQQKVDAGHYGRKTGKGFYDYTS